MEFCCCSKIFILTHAVDASLIRRELDTLIGPFKKKLRSDIIPVQFSYFNKKKGGKCNYFSFSCKPLGIPSRAHLQVPAPHFGNPPELQSHIQNLIPWSFPCDSDTLTASWLLKELTPIMPWEAVLAREGIWLWLRGTLYRASAMSAALFRMIS